VGVARCLSKYALAPIWSSGARAGRRRRPPRLHRSGAQGQWPHQVAEHSRAAGCASARVLPRGARSSSVAAAAARTAGGSTRRQARPSRGVVTRTGLCGSVHGLCDVRHPLYNCVAPRIAPHPHSSALLCSWCAGGAQRRRAGLLAIPVALDPPATPRARAQPPFRRWKSARTPRGRSSSARRCAQRLRGCPSRTLAAVPQQLRGDAGAKARLLDASGGRGELVACWGGRLNHGGRPPAAHPPPRGCCRGRAPGKAAGAHHSSGGGGKGGGGDGGGDVATAAAAVAAAARCVAAVPVV
jgi:hypothetical protein